MDNTCKNCNAEITGKFCPNCGQSSSTHRVSFHYLWHDFQHGFFHFDKGLVYTAKQLFTRPGHAIREYVEGKRVRHFKPVALVVLLATAYGLLYHYYHIDLLADENETGNPGDTALLKTLNDWISEHYAWATLLTIPFYSLGSYLAFLKQGYNYAEHLVLNSFLAGQRLFVHLATFPLLIYLHGTHHVDLFSNVLDVVEFVLLTWGYSQFFNSVSTVKSVLSTILSYTIFACSSVLVGVLALFIFSKL